MKAHFLFVISDPVIVAIVTGFFSLIVALLTFLTVLIKNKVTDISTKVDKYHTEVNGMKGELVEAVKGKGEAEGNLKGRLEQTEENNKKIEIPKI